MRKQIKAHPRITILILFLIVLAVTILIGGYRLNWAWTGFTGEKETYRTLYDWLQLLFIPVVLAIAGFWFNHRERKSAELRAENEQKAAELRTQTDREIEQQRAKAEQDLALDNQREAALQAYINEMSELLLHENLRKSEKDDEVRKIARVRTITVLPHLDSDRKGSMVQFLHESGLIHNDNTIIDLRDADLTDANLCGADLSYANLIEVNLNGANLHGARMDNANLEDASLKKANLIRAFMVFVNLNRGDLEGANLTSAFLDKANLDNAILSYANLTGASLEGIDLSYTSLDGAKINEKYIKKEISSIEGATMFDRSEYSL